MPQTSRSASLQCSTRNVAYSKQLLDAPGVVSENGSWHRTRAGSFTPQSLCRSCALKKNATEPLEQTRQLYPAPCLAKPAAAM